MLQKVCAWNRPLRKSITVRLPGISAAVRFEDSHNVKRHAEIARRPTQSAGAEPFDTRLVPVRSQPGKRLRLRQMLVDQLGHLEHGDLLLAAEDVFEFVISIDITTVFAVLKVMALDVGPDFLGHLCTRHGIAADHRR